MSGHVLSFLFPKLCRDNDAVVNDGYWCVYFTEYGTWNHHPCRLVFVYHKQSLPHLCIRKSPNCNRSSIFLLISQSHIMIRSSINLENYVDMTHQPALPLDLASGSDCPMASFKKFMTRDRACITSILWLGCDADGVIGYGWARFISR